MTTQASAQPPKTPTPPYIPWKTADNAVIGWKVVLPSRIDRSLLGSYAGSMQSGLLNALKYFALIDDNGVPTATLRSLVTADGETRKHHIAGLVRSGYPFLFQDGFDLTKATPQQLNEKFEATGITGETKGKAISFFTAMAKAGGIPLSPFVKTRERRSGARRSQPKKAQPRQQTPPPAPPANPGTPTGHAMRSVALPLCGGTLTLSGTFNPFDLAGDERDLVYSLIDKMNAFEKGGGK